MISVNLDRILVEINDLSFEFQFSVQSFNVLAHNIVSSSFFLPVISFPDIIYTVFLLKKKALVFRQGPVLLSVMILIISRNLLPATLG